MSRLLVLAAIVALAGGTVALTGADAQEEVGVRFVTPTDGTTVAPTVPVVMVATGLTVEPAGEVREQAGHFHILIDTDFIPAGQVVPKDEQHVHFGDGSTQTELTLTPGTHTVRLQFANGAHIALEGDQFRDEIVVTVAEAEEPAVAAPPAAGSGGFLSEDGGGVPILPIVLLAVGVAAFGVGAIGWRLSRTQR